MEVTTLAINPLMGKDALVDRAVASRNQALDLIQSGGGFAIGSGEPSFEILMERDCKKKWLGIILGALLVLAMVAVSGVMTPSAGISIFDLLGNNDQSRLPVYTRVAVVLAALGLSYFLAPSPWNFIFRGAISRYKNGFGADLLDKIDDTAGHLLTAEEDMVREIRRRQIRRLYFEDISVVRMERVHGGYHVRLIDWGDEVAAEVTHVETLAAEVFRDKVIAKMRTHRTKNNTRPS